MSENILNQPDTKSTTMPHTPISHDPSSKKRSPLRMIMIALLVLFIGVGLSLILKNYLSPQHPQPNTLYTGLYKNQPILFFRNMEMNMMHVATQEDTVSYISYQHASNAKNHHNEDYVDFNAIQDRKALFSYERFATIENFLLSNDKNYLVISFSGGKNDTTNYIYQSNLKTGESEKLYEHELMTGVPPYNSGTAYITNFIPERYVVFQFLRGSPPPAGAPGGVVVKNIQSGSEKVLGTVGDINLDLAGEKITFKELQKIKMPCRKVDGKKDPLCFATDTYKTGFAPSGKTLSQPLP